MYGHIDNSYYPTNSPSSLALIVLLGTYRQNYFESKVEWRIYVSIHWATVRSTNSYLPVKRQAVIWTSATFIINWTLMNKSQGSLNESQTVSFKKIH